MSDSWIIYRSLRNRVAFKTAYWMRGSDWTPSSSAAQRFATKEEAEAVAVGLQLRSERADVFVAKLGADCG